MPMMPPMAPFGLPFSPLGLNMNPSAPMSPMMMNMPMMMPPSMQMPIQQQQQPSTPSAEALAELRQQVDRLEQMVLDQVMKQDRSESNSS